MKTNIYYPSLLLFIYLATNLVTAQTIEGFKYPPNRAKPHTWFHWMNGNITKTGISKDIAAMKAAGIDGFYLFDIAWNTPEGPYPYASNEWLGMVAHCAAESEQNGIKMSFHNCSGWSSSGGPWVTPEKSMKWVVWSEKQISVNSDFVYLEEPQPQIGIHDKTLKTYNRHKKNRYYKDIAVIAFPTPKEPYRIKNWERKALLNGNDSRTKHFKPDDSIAPEDGVISMDDILDITKYLKPNGSLEWRPPQGNWTVIRFGYCSNGVSNHPASNRGCGLEVDKLDPTAVDLHWNEFLKHVIDTVKGHTKIHEMLIDSYEMGVQNWTQGFDIAFKDRYNYNILPYLPCFAGYTINDIVTTEQFLWDLRTTVRDLMHDNYFGHFKKKCHENNIALATEPYGKGPFDAVEIARMSDVPIGEFWYPDQPQKHWKPWSAKIAASGAHLSGRNVVGAEAFTSWNGDFKSMPTDLKPVMDKYYTLGINRNIFHTYAHQPWNNSVKPGMTMHRFGLNFHRNNTWFLEGKEFFTYMSRCQHIFQNGTYMADVLILYGDERGFYNLGGSDSKDVFLPGHNYDIGNMNVLKDLSVDENGDVRVTYQGKLLKNKYKVVLVKFGELMQIENIKLLGELAQQGAKILAPRPLRNPSLSSAKINIGDY
ncbi:MAG: hypothetical protein MI922_20085, partial [Bacteroidales bacterium]|nr:hypothetical protein [Bacteroidales bacterium]